MLHCPNCGTSNKDSSKFCNFCGILLTLSEQPSAICPYCGEELEKRPKRKKKCPFCQNFIYVRTLPATREKVLVTEEQAQRIQKEWDRIWRRNKWLDTLKTYGITEEIFESHKKSLSDQWKRVVADSDIIWSLFNELLQENMKLGDFHTLKMLYHNMAFFLDEEGQEFFGVLVERQRMELMEYKTQCGVAKVRITTSADSCPACKKLDGKVLTIQKALKTMPIPCKECTTTMYSKREGFCRCMYGAVMD
jgi:hypothetical protein